MARAKKPAQLSRYRQKRAASKTPEPFAEGAPSPAGLARFVVHMHAARRLHWDLRLEIGGTLVSWAIPKGPSPDPAEKRFAAHVEDHPLPYGDLEGIIPDGNYGAGPTIVWDQGALEFHEDPGAGLASGKHLFTLHGYKLRGMFTLVRIKSSAPKSSPRSSSNTSKDWLLIKKPDGFAQKGGYPELSVLSCLGVDELATV